MNKCMLLDDGTYICNARLHNPSVCEFFKPKNLKPHINNANNCGCVYWLLNLNKIHAGCSCKEAKLYATVEKKL